MKQILTAKEGWDWIKAQFTRKWTVWIHVVAGIFCGVLCHWYPAPAIVAFGAFGWFEWWQAEVEGDEGHLDFWDALVGFFAGLGIIWILNLVGVL